MFSTRRLFFWTLCVTLRSSWSVLSLCPPLGSGKCFLDCTQESYKMVCEQATTREVLYDLKIFSGLNTTLSLRLWHIPNIQRLGSSIFVPVNHLLEDLEIQNAPNLERFPELLGITRLKRLTLRVLPKVTYFPVELLPESIEAVNFRGTGIQTWRTNEEGTYLPVLRKFKLSNHHIDFISPDFFYSFPRLDTIILNNCTLNSAKLTNGRPFQTPSPLKHFAIIHGVPLGLTSSVGRFFEQLTKSLRIGFGSRIEFTSSSLLITREAVRTIRYWAPVSYLDLRGNRFGEYVSLIGTFEDFVNLEYVDFGNMLFPSAQPGSLRGLPSLNTLKLNSNKLENLVLMDFFAEFKPRNLSKLDLSRNDFRSFPAGMDRLGGNILELDLSWNFINPRDIWSNGAFFPYLKRLSLAGNRMTEFAGLYAGRFQRLEVLDISCNPFQNITRRFFRGLPRTLRVLNTSFCITDQEFRPKIDDDTFTQLSGIRELHLGGGFFKTYLFRLLQRLPNASSESLRVLSLPNNRIAYLEKDGSCFQRLSFLETLDLSRNQLQTIPPGSLSKLRNLVNLILSNNAIVAIGPDDFRDLEKLQFLDLSDNDIRNFAIGSFSSIPSLRGLFLAGNTIKSYDLLVASGTSSLEHLEMDPIFACIDESFFMKFPNIKRLYINRQWPIFLDVDPEFDVFEQELKTPMHSWSRMEFCDDRQRVSDMEWWTQYYTAADMAGEFLRLYVNPNGGRIYQTIFGLFAALCHESRPRNVSEIVRGFVCPHVGSIN